MGKTIFGLKVITKEGDMTLMQAVQRSSAYLIAALFGSFLFALSFIRKDDKSLADIFSGSTVGYDIAEKNISEAPEVGTEFQLSLVQSMNENSEEIEYFEQNKAA